MFARVLLLACLLVCVQAAKPEICCLALPVCPEGTTEDATCTWLDLWRGKCEPSSLCCRTIRCRKNAEICCQAVPTCPAGFEMTDPSVCSEQMWASNICKKVTQCCTTITCRTWVA